jgi:hypothetical protein
MRSELQQWITNRNHWVLAVFAIYLIAIPIFAEVYFLLYQAQRDNFSFNSDILHSQKEDVAASTKQQLSRTIEKLALLEELEPVLNTAILQHGFFKSASRQIPIVWVESSTAKYVYFEPATAATFNGSQTIQSKLRVERSDGRVTEIMDGPFSPLPKSIEAYKLVCSNWRSQLDQRITELKRIEASIETDAPDVWTYFDFVYFSAITQATVGYGDILPNKTPVRVLVTIQTILSAALVVVVINLAFKTTEPTRE